MLKYLKVLLIDPNMKIMYKMIKKKYTLSNMISTLLIFCEFSKFPKMSLYCFCKQKISSENHFFLY